MSWGRGGLARGHVGIGAGRGLGGRVGHALILCALEWVGCVGFVMGRHYHQGGITNGYSDTTAIQTREARGGRSKWQV